MINDSHQAEQAGRSATIQLSSFSASGNALSCHANLYSKATSNFFPVSIRSFMTGSSKGMPSSIRCA